MIRIKTVDAQNILPVCELTTSRDGIGATADGHFCCNAISIAEAKYDPELYPNAIYHNHVLIGFFMYQRPEDHTDTATICRFMIDDQFQQKGLAEQALEHILRGLKIQGVRRVIARLDHANENTRKLWLSFGFHSTGEYSQTEHCCILERSTTSTK